MKNIQSIKILFIVAALYDGLLGLAFLLAGGALFEWFAVTPANHPGYVQFPAALLVVFGIMFLNIAVNPAKYRNLIPYGILLKVTYCGIVAFYWITTNIPGMWKPFCIADFIFLLLFAWAWVALKDEPQA